MQVVKRSPQDTDLMVTPDWPSRKREMNWGWIGSTNPGKLASPDPTEGACNNKSVSELGGKRVKMQLKMWKEIVFLLCTIRDLIICDVQCPPAVILLSTASFNCTEVPWENPIPPRKKKQKTKMQIKGTVCTKATTEEFAIFAPSMQDFPF